MSFQEYQTLISDTVLYLKNLDCGHVISGKEVFLFFQEEIIRKNAKKTGCPTIELAKNIFPSRKSPTPPAITPKMEPKPFLTPVEPSSPKEAPPSVKKEEKKPLSKNLSFSNESADDDTLDDVKKIVLQILPNFELCPTLNDAKAKKNAEKYLLKSELASILILAYKENELAYSFLKHLAKALSICFMKTNVVSAFAMEKENSWDDLLSSKDLRLVISADYIIVELEKLRKHYKEFPNEKISFLKDVPLLLIPDTKLYLKDPLLKPSLLKTVKQKILSLNI